MSQRAAATRSHIQTIHQERINPQWWKKQAYTLKPSFLRCFSRTTTQGTSSLPETGHTTPEKRKAMLAGRQVHHHAGISFHCHHPVLNVINITPIFQMQTVCPGVHSVWGEGLKQGFNKGSFWPPNPHPLLHHAKSKCQSSLGDENDWFCKCKLPYNSSQPSPFAGLAALAKNPLPVLAGAVKRTNKLSKRHSYSKFHYTPFSIKLISLRTQHVFLWINNMKTFITGLLTYKTN